MLASENNLTAKKLLLYQEILPKLRNYPDEMNIVVNCIFDMHYGNAVPESVQ
jgi:hypothetical protein